MLWILIEMNILVCDKMRCLQQDIREMHWISNCPNQDYYVKRNVKQSSLKERKAYIDKTSSIDFNSTNIVPLKKQRSNNLFSNYMTTFTNSFSCDMCWKTTNAQRQIFFYSESIFALINSLIKNLPSTSTLMTLPAISQGIAQGIHANRTSYLSI